MTPDHPSIHQSRIPVSTLALVSVVLVTCYIATVGLVPACSRHMEDGQLQWLRSSPVASTAMVIYEWPARQASAVPPLRWLLEMSASVWCAITNAPETTG